MAQSVPQQSVLDDNSALENVSRIGTPQRPGGAKINLTPVLGVIDEILSWANKSISDVLDGKFDKSFLTSKTVPAGSSADAIGSLASVINKISCELKCKCSGGDANKSTTVILDMLKDYQSGTKAVIAIAAFVLKYVEFCLFAQLGSGHPLARYLRILELLPNIAAHRYTLERLFELIEVIVKLAKEMVQLDDLNDKHFSEDILPRKNAMSNIDDYAKLVISSVVVCTEQIASLAGISTEITTLSSVEKLIKQAKRELIFMQLSLSRCRDVIEENQSEKIGKKLEDAHSLGEVLAIIFNLEQTTLIRCKESTEKQEMTVLLKKRVLILISYLDIREVEIDSLSEFYKKWQGESETEQQTEIVWLPVKETGTSWCHTKVEDVRRSMPWCTIKEPNLIKEEVFSYIKQQWHTQRKTSLVVLDSAGKVQSKDFLEMLWMWGSSVKKFSQIDEKALWKKYNSVFKLIFCRVGYEINLDEVNNRKKIVCFYGGEDIDWIKKFTELASTVAKKKGSTIDLTYVGKSFHQDKVKDNIKVI